MPRRWLIRCSLLLVAAALLNLAVALGCTLRAQRRPGPVTRPNWIETEALWREHDLSPTPPALAYGARSEQAGYRELLVGVFASLPTDVGIPPRHLSMLEIRAGLPLRSMVHSRIWAEDVDTWNKRHIWRRNVLSTASPDPILPTRPHWPAFALNTLLYAAVLLLPVAPGLIRRLVRSQRGQCTGCGYPVGTSACCTECGLAVRGSAPIELSAGLDHVNG